MAQIIKQNRKTFWLDPEGDPVPIKFISPQDQSKDALIESLHKDALDLHQTLALFKAKALEMIDSYLQQVAASYHENWKGNATIYNFSMDKAIEIKISNKLAFDERLNIAKQKIDEYILSLVRNAGKEIIALITKAFKVDAKGNVDVKQIIALKQHKFDHPLWKEAMAIIDEALRVEATRRYIVFKQKDDSGSWISITLNFSAM